MARASQGADSSGSLVDGGDFRIQFDHAFFLSPLSISGINSIVDPGGKIFSNNGIDYVGSILPRELVSFTFYCWKSVPDLIVWLCKLEHGLNLQTFEKRYRNVFDLRIFDDPLFATSKITKVENCHVLEGWQISAAFGGDKTVNLTFILVLSCKSTRADENFRWVRIW